MNRYKIADVIGDILFKTNKDADYLIGGPKSLDEIPDARKALEEARDILAKEPGTVEEEWPKNLLLDIGIVVRDAEIPEIMDNLLYVLDTLKESDKDIMLLRYKEGLSYTEIGKKFGINTERVRQLVTKNIRFLSRQDRITLICVGKDAVNDYRTLRDQYFEELERLRDTMLKEKYLLDSDAPKEQLAMFNKDIAYLGVSTRCYNTLRRAGIKKIGDLNGLSKRNLFNMRNMGASTVDELCEAADKFGIHIE